MTAAAALALLAAFLLAPDAAWGQVDQCGAATGSTHSCDDGAYSTGIYYATSGSDNLALTVRGGAATTITPVTTSALTFPFGIALRSADTGATGDLALTVGSVGAVTIAGGGNDSVGIFLNQQGTGTATTNVGDTVTIGSSDTRIGRAGIQFIITPSAGNVGVTNAAAIYSNDAGIDVSHSGTGAATTSVSNRGAIDANGHAIHVRTAGTGAMTVSNSGDLKAANADKRGINLLAEGNGAITLALTGGRIESVAAQGVRVESQGAGAVTIEGTPADADTPSGPTIMAATHGIHIDKKDADATAGDISITTTGGSITTGITTGDEDPPQDRHGIFVEDNTGYTGSVTIDNAAGITASEYGIYANRAGAGAVSVTHRAGTVLGRTQSGIHIENAGVGRETPDPSDVTVTVEGGMVRSIGQGRPAIAAYNRGSGGVSVTIADGATASSRQDAGIFASLGSYDSRVKVTQGGAILGRTGVLAQAPHASTVTVAPRQAEAQPVIDIVWTGTFADGNTAMTAPNDDDRLVATTVLEALHQAREVAAATSTGIYGAPAGIEAQVMPWRIVARNVATGEGFILYPDLAAQQALFDSTSSQELQARGDAIVAQLRAALESDAINTRDAVAAVEAVMPDGGAADGELSRDEIVAYLSVPNAATQSLLTGVLTFGLSEAEQAVLRALANGDRAALDTALGNEVAAFSDGYKTAMRALLDRYNVGDIRIAMNGGSIGSSDAPVRGDGIRAYYATANENNGAIDVTVAEGAEVTGARAGVWVANAGLDAGEDGMADTADDILKQTVTVHGMVRGGTDAAVHLVGGGRLTVGRTGQVLAGSSGRAIWVNDPGRAVIRIDGLVRGGAGPEGNPAPAAVHLTGGGSVTVGMTGRVEAKGAAYGIRGDNEPTRVSVLQDVNLANKEGLSREGVADALARLGTVGGDGVGETAPVSVDETTPAGRTGYYLPLAIGTDGTLSPEDPAAYRDLPPCRDGRELRDDECMTPPPPPMEEEELTNMDEDDQNGLDLPMSCDKADDGRCQMYEALPSMLLAMNGLSTYGERMSAARDARGGWARVEAARGKWKADSSTRENVAYDHRRSGVHAGMDFAMGDAGRVGVSVHGLKGSAEMAARAGEVDLSGSGLGVHGTTAFAGGFYLDAQAAATWYDADLKSAHGTLKNDVNGRGYALGVEVGKRLPAMDGGVTLTPRAGLRWSKVVLSDFRDPGSMTGLGALVSVKDARSLKGRAGVGAEKALDGPGWTGARLFGSLDVEQEFKEETEANVMGSPPLKASAKKTRIRAAAGGVRVWDEGRYVLQGSMGYTAGGGDNREFGGGLSFAVRF